MKSSEPRKISSLEEVQVISRFEDLRTILQTEPYAGHRGKSLAYWARPTDRRLPLALLGRSLGDLLNTPFSELAATPGIGQKKICSFVKLLGRAANTDPSLLRGQHEVPPPNGKPQAARPTSSNGFEPSNGFDPSTVSEVLWGQWRATVIGHGLGGEALGRFAPSLRNMTRAVWDTPLGAYAESSLADIRVRKTHGEKRVRAILEVFHGLHGLLSTTGPSEHLSLRIAPKWVDTAELWVGRTLQTPGIPMSGEIFERFVSPLLEQVRLDATEQVTRLAENRLGIHGPITSVRQAARTIGLTRARLYQLLNELNDIMTVRWPLGRHQVYELRDKFRMDSASLDPAPDLGQFHAAIELFYPASRRGASDSLENALSAHHYHGNGNGHNETVGRPPHAHLAAGPHGSVGRSPENPGGRHEDVVGSHLGHGAD